MLHLDFKKFFSPDKEKYSISLFKVLLTNFLFLRNSDSKSPFIRPNQFLYDTILSSASTVATLSSQSVSYTHLTLPTTPYV